MALELKKFLPKFYKQLHFNAMPVEARAQFEEWVKNDTLTDTMRLWGADFLEHDANGNLLRDANGKIVVNFNQVLEPAAELDDADFEKLFMMMQRAVSGMAANKDSFERTNASAKEFLDDYFGSLFTVAQATTDAENAINELYTEILGKPDNDATAKNIRTYILQSATDDKGEKLFKDAGELTKFIKDVNDKKYNKDLKTQTKLQKVASLLYNAVSWSSSFDTSSNEYALISNIRDSLDKIVADDAFSDVTMPAVFKNPDPHNIFYAGNILRQLYEDKNVFVEFSKYDDGKISKHITKARDFAKYDDKNDENYVPPKHDDQLNFIQQIEKYASDTYSDCFKKYSKMRGDHLFFKPEAKDIFKAIDKLKIKPTDGLPALLSKAGEISNKITNPVAKQDFKWFTETMSEINGAMPKAVESCWRNPTQMKAVLQEIMIKAVTDSRNDSKAIEKAKTAMEIMTAMKYGLVSSRTMEALKSTEFSLFSDKGLSWNKSNAGVQMVTTAFDKGIKAAFLGIGYTVVIVGNKIRMRNKNFTEKDNKKKNANDKRGARIGNYIDAEQHYQGNRRAMAENRDNYLNTRDQQSIVQEQNNLNALGPNYTSATIDARRNDLANATATKNRLQANYDAYNAATTRETNYSDTQTKETNLTNEIAQINRDIHQKQQDIIAKQNEINIALVNGTAAVVGHRLDAELQQLKQEQQTLRNNLNSKNTELNDVQATLRNLTGQHTADIGTIGRLQHDKDQYDTATADEQELTDKIKQFEDATAQIQELNDHITRRNAAQATWDNEYQNRFFELENYWNYLQTGQATNFWGKLSTKAAQKRFDNNKQAWLQEFVATHGIRA